MVAHDGGAPGASVVSDGAKYATQLQTADITAVFVSLLWSCWQHGPISQGPAMRCVAVLLLAVLLLGC